MRGPKLALELGTRGSQEILFEIGQMNAGLVLRLPEIAASNPRERQVVPLPKAETHSARAQPLESISIGIAELRPRRESRATGRV